MNLKARLSRMQEQAGGGTGSTPSLSDLRGRIAQLEKRRPGRSRSPAAVSAASAAALLARLDGEQIADGLIRIRKRVPLRGQLGSIALQSLRSIPCLPGEAGNQKWRQVRQSHLAG